MSDEDNIIELRGAKEKAARDALRAARAINDLAALERKIMAIVPGAEFMGMAPATWEPDKYGMPPYCPVIPLGREGNTCHILTANGTRMGLDDTSQSRKLFLNAFGHCQNYLFWAWPKWNEKKERYLFDNFDSEKVYNAFVFACSLKMQEDGPWEEKSRMRGRGVWRVDDGLLLHLGDRIILPSGQIIPPGEHNGMLYHKRPRVVGPSKVSRAGDEMGPGNLLFKQLETWHWTRPEIDPFLLLGWIGQAFLSGAVKWRSVAWIVGGAGTGKSTLIRLCEGLFGDMFQRADNATAASVYRGLGGDAIPVLLDESEEQGKNESRSGALVELSRQAASGALVQRAGGKNGEVQSFPVSSSFMFAAITPPAMQPADYTRMIKLSLRPLKEQADLGQWQHTQFLAQIGSEIFARVVADFTRVEACMAAYQKELTRIGHNSRGADTFGTLLGIAHVLSDDDPPMENEVRALCAELSPSRLEELEFASANWADCWDVLMSAQPLAYRADAAKSVRAKLNIWRTDHLRTPGEDDADANLNRLRRELALVGLGVIVPRGCPPHSYEDALLFVPSLSAAQENLTKGTAYDGRAKVATALKQMPEEWIVPNIVGRIDGESKKGLGIRLGKAFPKGED